MPAILPSVKIDSDSMLSEYFMTQQVAWILGEDELHAQKKQVFAIGEKSVRVGWTYGDPFKNVRKRLRFPKRDYLLTTKDYPSAIEYMRLAHEFTDLFKFTRAIVSHGEDFLKVNRIGPDGRPTSFQEEVKISYIKFDNGSRIIAFSAHPQAMAVYGGDVGIDEFAKHPNAQLLWQTAQGRVTWGYDMAIWSSHEGEDTLFNQFVQQARAGKPPWNLYYRVTIVDAVELGLVEFINRTRGTTFTREQFLEDCRARAGLDEIFQQSYMCNPVPSGASIVEWSAIERCRLDYQIERLHLEATDITREFGEFNPSDQHNRRLRIQQFIRSKFPSLFTSSLSSSTEERARVRSRSASSIKNARLGFDVAASGKGDLGVFYIDEPNGDQLSLRGLLTVRTDDWDFIETVLFLFMKELPSVKGAGDSTGLGSEICWKAEKHFHDRFLPVNFSSKKHELGFALMNQLSVAEKRFPKAEADIAGDYFALRKILNGTKWVFSEGRNSFNPDSHCDIAWAGALATHAHSELKSSFGAAVLMEDGSIWSTSSEDRPAPSPENQLLWSNDPRIWKPLR